MNFFLTTKLSHEQLEQIIKSGATKINGKEVSFLENNALLIQNIEIEDTAPITEFRNVRYKINFDTCTFLTKVNVSLKGSRLSCTFHKCQFKDEVSFDYITVNDQIILNECHFFSDLYFDFHGLFDRVLSNIEVDGYLIITQKGGKLLIKDINKNTDNAGGLKFQRIVISYLTIANSRFYDIEISSKIENEAIMVNSYAKEFYFKHATIGLNFIIESSEILNFQIDNLSEGKRFIELKSTKFGKASIVLEMIQNLKIKDCKFNTIEFRNSLEKDAVVDCSYSSFSTFIFSKVNNKGEIHLDKLRVDSIFFFRLIELG